MLIGAYNLGNMGLKNAAPGAFNKAINAIRNPIPMGGKGGLALWAVIGAIAMGRVHAGALLVAVVAPASDWLGYPRKLRRDKNRVFNCDCMGRQIASDEHRRRESLRTRQALFYWLDRGTGVQHGPGLCH